MKSKEAIITSVTTIVVALITTWGTIAVSKPEALKVKKELEEISDYERIANLPIGSIISSMLEPEKFEKVVGDPSVFDPKKSKWVFADGEVDITNSEYGDEMGQRYTPDLRAMFLRGINEKRNDEYSDPASKRVAGSEQKHAFEKHQHSIPIDYHKNPASPAGWRMTHGQHADGPHTKLSGPAGTQKETRPNNVAVYFYIKIN